MTEQTTGGPGGGVLARAVLAGAGLPIAIGAVGVALVLSWRDDLPARVASHWGIDGTADGFSSVSAVAWLIGGFAAGFAVLGLALVLAVRADATITRVVAATTAGTTAFVTALVVLLTERQRGLGDATGVELPGAVLAGALAAGVVVAVLAAVLVPRWSPGARPLGPLPPGATTAPHLDVGAGERVVWTRSAATGGVPAVVLIADVGVTAAIGIVGRQWWVLGLSVVLALLAAAMFSITVTVDERGLRVRGRFGRPRLHTSLDRIARASTVTVRPVRDFGGWGYRVSAVGPLRGARGYVLRGGEALLVERTDGARTVVTVDDAVTAAALLNALLERRFGGV
ncbi:DUF1648 domain-containing protein [Jiangella alkaliphila]|uniref:DUF1648 domain-containing protein n=1 Tax=Jiangella alkaliphila TaxID=419479 RepID=A0A1H2I5B2_9ACTN|nr:DUF1648 domain-containing protein [Jiangella alkaliphila]SDU39008.1 Protein of unknown function [Jiangella alkaliphila]